MGCRGAGTPRPLLGQRAAQRCLVRCGEGDGGTLALRASTIAIRRSSISTPPLQGGHLAAIKSRPPCEPPESGRREAKARPAAEEEPRSEPRTTITMFAHQEKEDDGNSLQRHSPLPAWIGRRAALTARAPKFPRRRARRCRGLRARVSQRNGRRAARRDPF